MTQAIDITSLVQTLASYGVPSAQIAQVRELARDRDTVDWLSKHYIGPDFRYGDPACEVVVIEMPAGKSYCGDFRLDMNAARGA